MRRNLSFLALLATVAYTAEAGVINSPDVGGFSTFKDTTTGRVWLDLNNFYNASATSGASGYAMIAAAEKAGFTFATRSDVGQLLGSLPLNGGEWASYSSIMGSSAPRKLIWGMYDDGSGNPYGWAFSFSTSPIWNYSDNSTNANFVQNASNPGAMDLGIWAYQTSTPSVEPTNYGLFIGARATSGIIDARFDLVAKALADKFDTKPNSISFTLTGDLSPVNGSPADPITLSEISSALSSIRAVMRGDDTLTVYIGGHGGSDQTNIITKFGSGSGDEFIRTGDRVYDNWLADQLALFGNSTKTVFLDACHSGGFWGSGDPDERLGSSDLDKLSNIALYSAAPESYLTFMDGNGYGIYSLALLDAMEDHSDLTGQALADFLKTRSRELASFPNYPFPRYFEQEFGSEYPVDPSLLQSGYNQSGDYALGQNQISEPAPIALLLFSLAISIFSRRSNPAQSANSLRSLALDGASHRAADAYSRKLSKRLRSQLTGLRQ